MIASPDDKNKEAPSLDTDRSTGLVVVDIGNSSLHLGVWSDEGVAGVVRIDHEDWTGLDAALRGLVPNSRKADLAAAVVACVVPDALERAEQAISDALGLKALVVGRDVFRPLRLAVNDPEAVGIDRVCSAAAAYAKVGGGCTVVDFGTAVTVDLVDDDGVFQGGAILPGLRLQAVALGNHTSALPVVSARFPEHPVGKDTTEAICSGICYGMAGAVRGLVEGFAARLNRWPYVVATGGDAAMMAEHCDFIDTVVTDLCLYGVGHAYVKHLNSPPGE